jgi:dihydroxyacetone kinase-like protein
VTAKTATAALIPLLGESETSTPSEFLRACGMTLAKKAPSSMGTLVARAFLGAAKEDVEVEGVAAAARWLDAGRRAIEKSGGATVGQKSMLDALAPAIAALESHSDAPVTQALAAAADAAEAGAEATKQMEPSVGRAGWLTERSRGNVDAGAWLVAFFFRSWANRAQEDEAVTPSA